MRERLQKIIAHAGLASRRAAERLILDGQVRVNGKVASLGDSADPEADHIKVSGKLIPRAEGKEYQLFYKPRGVITTAVDPEGRPTVFEFFESFANRLFPVGRLDLDSEGLLIMTNDGDLANALMRPKSEIPKRYRVKTKGIPGERAIALLRKGVPLSDGRTAPAQVTLMETTKTNAWFEVIIHEGKNRQIRRMFDHVHHSVVKLKRTGYAFLGVGDLTSGTARKLTATEVERLWKLARGDVKASATPAKPKFDPRQAEKFGATTPKGGKSKPPAKGGKPNLPTQGNKPFKKAR